MGLRPVEYFCFSGTQLWIDGWTTLTYSCECYFSACLYMDRQSVWRRSLLQISLRTFLMSHWGQIKRPCAWHWHETSRQGLYAREARLNLAVSEHITGRFQIIVRPVLALVIRHAVLSEARAAGEVKRQWHEVLLLARRGPAPSLRMQSDRLWHRFCLDDAQRSLYSCLEIHCYLSRGCQTWAVQLEL